MQAVILAAGKSTRAHPLTINRPKPLIKIGDRTILQHNLEQLMGLVDEVIVVVGYRKEMIKDFLGNEFNDLKITYVEQDEQLGPGHAVKQAEGLIKDRFIVMNGDDLYSREDIETCVKHRYCLLVQEVEEPSQFGVVVTENGLVKRIVEKPKEFISNLVNTGLYVFDKRIFDLNLEKTERSEYEITDYVSWIAQKDKVYFESVKGCWIPITYPWSMLKANEYLLGKMQGQVIKGYVEDNVVIKGPMFIGEGTVIKGGTYIEGPVYIGKGCTIGPGAYLRPNSTIGDNCRIRAEVVDSIIMDNTTAKHFSYLGHSVIGENVNIAAGTITADYRHDGENHVSVVKGEKVDTQRRKLGAMIGDNVSTGINTIIYPGRKIWVEKSTLPGQVVKEDIV